MVAAEVVEFISIASAHFKCASTRIKNCRPLTGPAISTWGRWGSWTADWPCAEWCRKTHVAALLPPPGAPLSSSPKCGSQTQNRFWDKRLTTINTQAQRIYTNWINNEYTALVQELNYLVPQKVTGCQTSHTSFAPSQETTPSWYR